MIGIIGGSAPTRSEVSLAEAVGRQLADAGAVLVCGGRGGVMEAACRGAKGAGGLTIGILPGTSRHQANSYVDIPIVTGIGEARNAVIARTAEAVIAIGGSYGTLSEIAFALGFGTPVVGLGTWGMERKGHPAVPVTYVETPEEAVEQALARAQETHHGGTGPGD
ncbi:MAG: TIGR00725 family protein [Anaerolineae bacterium]